MAIQEINLWRVREFELYILGESGSLNSICSFHAFVTDAIGLVEGIMETSGLAAYGKVIPELFENFGQH